MVARFPEDEKLSLPRASRPQARKDFLSLTVFFHATYDEPSERGTTLGLKLTFAVGPHLLTIFLHTKLSSTLWYIVI